MGQNSPFRRVGVLSCMEKTTSLITVCKDAAVLHSVGIARGSYDEYTIHLDTIVARRPAGFGFLQLTAQTCVHHPCLLSSCPLFHPHQQIRYGGLLSQKFCKRGHKRWCLFIFHVALDFGEEGPSEHAFVN